MSILWTSPDGLWGVIEAKDLPPGVARSKTRDDEQDAQNAPWDPGLTTPVGPGSIHKFVKVRISDLPHLQSGPKPTIVLKPGNYANKPAQKFIPEYPHTCPVCGGKMLMLFSSQEHEGRKPCPGPPSVVDRYLKKRKP